jgi:hypothetical protein
MCRTLRILTVPVLTFVLLLWLWCPPAAMWGQELGQSAPPVTPKFKHPNLDSVLYEFDEEHTQQGRGYGLSLAHTRGISVDSQDRVTVFLIAAAGKKARDIDPPALGAPRRHDSSQTMSRDPAGATETGTASNAGDPVFAFRAVPITMAHPVRPKAPTHRPGNPGSAGNPDPVNRGPSGFLKGGCDGHEFISATAPTVLGSIGF